MEIETQIMLASLNELAKGNIDNEKLVELKKMYEKVSRYLTVLNNSSSQSESWIYFRSMA